MQIENNILKYYLRNTYFLNGTAYAGKSTTARLLAEKYDMILCGENYHDDVAQRVRTPERQPALSYFDTMSGWAEFLNRDPADYYQWIQDGAAEGAQFEVAELIKLSATGKRVIVDTNISPELLKEISDYRHVALMLSPQSMSVDRFFDRDDPEKQFLRRQIDLCPDPAATMARFRASLALINGPQEYVRFAESGFFTIVREAADGDTREAVAERVARHFGLLDPAADKG